MPCRITLARPARRAPDRRTALRCLAIVALLATAPAGADPALTDAERDWIASAEPVLRAGRAAGLAVAVVVQPTDNAGQSPVASAWHDGECLLVLTLRGATDPVAQAGRDAPPADVLRQAVVAHEFAHCLRQAGGEWQRWPAGMAAPAQPDTDDAHLAGLRAEMAATRREEGYADLAALAWTAAHHRPRYAAVHAWLWSQRDDGSPDGSHHDTRAWLALARRPAAFEQDPGATTPWAQALMPWRAGLR